MASFREKNNQINSTRTTLLLLANNELAHIKKNNNTKINSKKISEAENYYNSGNNYIIKLKEENFISNSMTRDIIQNKNIKKNFSFKSPDHQNNNFIRKMSISNKNNPKITIRESTVDVFDDCEKNKFELRMKLFENKSDISSKKNKYFKLKTLKINSEKNPLDSKIYLLKDFIFFLQFYF